MEAAGSDRDRLRFVELLEERTQRFGLRLHAYVLMDNYYHLLVQTPQTNLSQAMQWLGVSYTTWFNRRHGRVGHLFQGRFKAIILEAETAAVEVSRYLHLNPVREGLAESPWERLEAGVVLGGKRFVERMRRCVRGDEREQPQMRRLRARRSWGEVVAVVEKVKGERWEGFRDRYGDWGRDLALYLGQRRCGMKLRELAQQVGGIDYVSVAGATRRFAERVGQDKQLAAAVERALETLNNK